MSTISARVRAAIKAAGRTQKQVASEVGMTPDALSRALNGQRGFGAAELADLASNLGADLHELITGEPDSRRFTASGRHAYDRATRDRSIDGYANDLDALESIHLAYLQAGEPPASNPLPRSAAELRSLLGDGFVRELVDRLDAVAVDVIRLPGLSTSYHIPFGDRHIIALGITGNWFRDNWSLAHELGHVCLRHDSVLPGSPTNDVDEAAANRFAAELLLPEQTMREHDWSTMTAAELAHWLWSQGVSIEATRNRLERLRIDPSPEVESLLASTLSTQRVLRTHWRGDGAPDPISARMAAASSRRFPQWLIDAHFRGVELGAIGKSTLAWMLDVPPAELQIEEPADEPELSAAQLDELLG